MIAYPIPWIGRPDVVWSGRKVFMPTTCPRKLINGPPLLPGLIAVSVCMYSALLAETDATETMPLVRVATRVSPSAGKPRANTSSPARTPAESPNSSLVCGSTPPNSTTAKSTNAERPPTTPRTLLPSWKTISTDSAPRTTWALVTTHPASKTNPEPRPFDLNTCTTPGLIDSTISGMDVVDVSVAVGVGVGLRVAVGVGVRVAVGLGVCVGVGFGVTVGLGVCVGVGFGVTVGVKV